MAQPTHPNPPPMPQQRPTPGMGATPGTVPAGGSAAPAPPRAGMMGAAPAGIGRPSMSGVEQTPETAPAEPVLFSDIDPVLLCRLYPQAASGDAARAEAEAAGAAAHDAGMKLVAAQQEPPLPETTAG